MELTQGHLKAYKIDLSIDKYLLHHIDHKCNVERKQEATEYIEQYWYMNVMSNRLASPSSNTEALAREQKSRVHHTDCLISEQKVSKG